MTTAEAAKIAGRRPTTIRHWIKTGRLTAGTAPSPKPPWEVFDITPEDLAAAIAAQRRPGRPYKNLSAAIAAISAKTAPVQAEGEPKP